MKEHDIATPRDLDVASSANAVYKHSQLWKAAEGRSFRWAEMFGLGCAILILGIGFARLFKDANGTLEIVFGLAFVAMFVSSRRQRQLNALVEIVTRLEQDVRERRAGA